MNAHKPILDGYFWELFQGKDLWGGGVRTRQYFKQTVSSLKRKKNMASVWKRLQRVGKHASKFQFVASYQELMVECTKKWWVVTACMSCASRYSFPAQLVRVCLECWVGLWRIWLTAMIYPFPRAFLCVGRGDSQLYFSISYCLFSPLCLGIVHDRLQWSLKCPPYISADRM